jgi:deferrochelatase/peroxidase EfeB
MSPELSDIQGLIHHHYGYPKLRHLLFNIGSPASGRQLLKFLAPRVTHAAMNLDPGPDVLLNVGITFAGLQSLKLDSDLLACFPIDFKEAPDSTVMGDVGASHPDRWWKGFTDANLVVHLFARSTETLEAITSEVREAAAGNTEILPTSAGGPIEGGMLGTIRGELHFGYRDGISHPDVRWSDDPGSPGSIDYRNFLLGYSTPQIPSSPKVFASVPASARAAGLARNGSYSVFRVLIQNVAAFNQFLATEGPRAFPELPPTDAQELLAAKLMGRWRDGTPLIRSPVAPDIAFANDNSFNYSQDAAGLRCPISAHIRVTNPRDQALDPPPKVIGVPQVIRRGAPFGTKLEGTVDDNQERGLAGLFICSSITRQFYTLMEWMKENSFSPSFQDPRAQDPLANHEVPSASKEFLIPTESGVRSVTLPNMVTTRGTAFFLLPSLTSINRLAGDDPI